MAGTIRDDQYRRMKLREPVHERRAAVIPEKIRELIEEGKTLLRAAQDYKCKRSSRGRS